MKVKRDLGAEVGTEEFRKEYVAMRVNKWVDELMLLSKIAKSYPPAAYCAFTSGFREKFNYVIRTIPNISHLLQPIENVIRHEFITSLFEWKACNDGERQLYLLNSMELVKQISINIRHRTPNFEKDNEKLGG